jgi:hypothetical protein
MFQLLFLEDSHIHPTAQIFLKRRQYDGIDELIPVTRECANATEMYEQLDRLRADIDMLCEEVGRQFASERPSLGDAMNSENPDDNDPPAPAAASETAATAEASIDVSVRHLASLDRGTYESVPKQEAQRLGRLSTSDPGQCSEV